MKSIKNVVHENVLEDQSQKSKFSSVQTPKNPLFADAREFKKGRHRPSELMAREWMMKTAKSISNATNAELETNVGLHGSPYHSKGTPKKNGRYASKVLRKEAGTTSERNKDLAARNLIAQGWLPKITTYGCSDIEELAYGTTRNFDDRWPRDPNKPIPLQLMAAAKQEVQCRESFYASKDKKIKLHPVLLKKLRTALCKFIHNANALHGFVVDSTPDIDLVDGQDIPALMIALFDLDERLSDCNLFVPVKPPAISIDLSRGTQGAIEFLLGENSKVESKTSLHAL